MRSPADIDDDHRTDPVNVVSTQGGELSSKSGADGSSAGTDYGKMK